MAKKTASTELEVYREKGANMLINKSHIDGLSDWHTAVVESVELSPDPNQDDVYYEPQVEGLVITGKGLSKLALCAGVVWNIDQTRRTDDRHDPMYCSYQAVGGIKKPDGTYVWMKGEYDIDMEVLKEQLVESYTEKARKGKKDKGWIDYCVKRDLGQKQKHKIKLCETGAKNRVIRALLGIKSKYSKKELSKPFVTARIVFQPDMTDPDVKRAMIGVAIQQMTGIYGPPTAPQIETRDSDIIDIPHETIPPDPVWDDDIPDPGEDDSELGMDNSASRRLDFENMGQDDQVKTLEKMMETKGYDKSQLTHPLDTFKETHRLKFFDKLAAMDDDDIPF